jgi:hypothetical protein
MWIQMQFRRHSPTAHAAYNDLLRLLRDDEVSAIRGTPTRVVRGNRVYWYDTYRVGTEVQKHYIGEETEELLIRLDRHEKLKQEQKTRASERMRLVRLLRAEGFLSVDAGTGSFLNALAGAGVFRLGGTLVGTHAFRLYEGLLGIRYSLDDAAMTRDIDIASFEKLSLVVDDSVSPSLEEVFRDFSFEPVGSLAHERTWRWRQGREDTLVEFLTPSFEEDEGLRHLPSLGVDAQSLHYLNYLLSEPEKAAVLYRSGVLVQVPRPERFAVHKLIVSTRRSDRLKALKDLRQAEFLIAVLAQDRPDELAAAWDIAWSQGKRWRERLEKALDRSPDTAERIASLQKTQ